MCRAVCRGAMTLEEGRAIFLAPDAMDRRDVVCEQQSVDAVNAALTAMENAMDVLIDDLCRRGTEEGLPLVRATLRGLN